jgi:hypothetical protein
VDGLYGYSHNHNSGTFKTLMTLKTTYEEVAALLANKITGLLMLLYTAC